MILVILKSVNFNAYTVGEGNEYPISNQASLNEHTTISLLSFFSKIIGKIKKVIDNVATEIAKIIFDK